jgi:hypothetical protein
MAWGHYRSIHCEAPISATNMAQRGSEKSSDHLISTGGPELRAEAGLCLRRILRMFDVSPGYSGFCMIVCYLEALARSGLGGTGRGANRDPASANHG